MAQSKLDKQQKALERLTSSIGDELAAGRSIGFDKRQEYNKLKSVLSKAGRTHPGSI